MTINRNKELDTTSVTLVNRANETHKRNARAKAYSRSVHRKAELKSKVRCGIICAALLTIGGVPLVMGVQNVVANDIITEEPTEITTTTSRTETAVLVDINEDGDYILQTEDGNLWGIQDGEEIYFELEFSSNGNEVEDDIITNVTLMN